MEQLLKPLGLTMKAIGEAQMPTLETIFRDWCQRLGLTIFSITLADWMPFARFDLCGMQYASALGNHA
jgi:hypothetical protein